MLFNQNVFKFYVIVSDVFLVSLSVFLSYLRFLMTWRFSYHIDSYRIGDRWKSFSTCFE